MSRATMNTVGTKAYLDSTHGLIPCVVTHITSEGVTVDFDEDAPALHWSGQTKNAWAGRKGVTFHATRVVPRSAVHGQYKDQIRPYKWESP